MSWSRQKTSVIRIGILAACLLPLAVLTERAVTGDLSANPVEFITHTTGDWALRLLLVTLSITPARRLFKMPELIRFRRMLGLFAFFYACLHLLTFAALDHEFSPSEIMEDVRKHRFILAGFVAFVLLIPLAITSTAGWIRRLGGRRWSMLHRLIYASAILAVIHFVWLVKSDLREPGLYGLATAILLGMRIVHWFRTRQAKG